MWKGFLLVACLCIAATAQAGESGLITKKSHRSVSETLNTLEHTLRGKGLTIFAHVSHTKGAKGEGIALRPTELLIFGNPKVGSHFFTSKQTAGIDLPMKALVWQDANGQVWLTYNDPQYIADRHGIKDRPEIVEKMTKALDTFTDLATQAPKRSR